MTTLINFLNGNGKHFHVTFSRDINTEELIMITEDNSFVVEDDGTLTELGFQCPVCFTGTEKGDVVLNHRLLCSECSEEHKEHIEMLEFVRDCHLSSS